MERIWMVIEPGAEHTRLLATDGPRATLLRGRLTARPRHPRALASLLEGLALWQNRPVHAVLAADDDLFGFAPNSGLDFGFAAVTPLYTLDLVAPGHPARRRGGGRDGLGRFDDLRRLLAREVAR